MEQFSVFSVLASLNYKTTRKKKLKYSFYDLDEGMVTRMPKLSYGVNPDSAKTVVTVLPDGKETKNIANIGDIVISGISGEKYVIRAEKFSRLYVGKIGETITPEQSERTVARYTGSKTITFTAPWGENMILKTGDYVVKESDGSSYYRIAKAEFEKTYEPIPK
jgi:hypothetical protein